MKFVIPTAIIATLAITFAIAPTTKPVAAQQGTHCADRETVIERLTTGFGEIRHSVGIGSNNVIVETFANDTTGTWTIIITLPTGATCFAASGQAFETATLTAPTPEPNL
jgi:hypothetical protein